MLDTYFKLVMFGLSTVLIEFLVCKHLNSLLCWLLALKCLALLTLGTLAPGIILCLLLVP